MNILKDSFYLTLSKGIRSIVMMIVVMAMTRVTSLEIYGAYRQLVTLSTIILAIAPLGIPTSVSYYYKNIDEIRKSRLVSNTTAICLLCGLASSLLFIIFRGRIAGSMNIEGIDRYLLAFSFYIFILVASSYIENVFVSAELAKRFSIFNCVYYILFTVILITVIYRDGRLTSILMIMAALEAMRFAALLVWIMLKLKIRFCIDPGFLREQFAYCIPLGLVGIMQVLNTHLDKLIISGSFSASDFAVYSTGTMEIPIVSLVTVSLATAALPHMSKEYNTNHDIKKVLDIWGKVTVTGAVLIFPVFFILGLYNRGYIGFLFSDKYFSSIPVFLIRLLRLPLSCTIFGNILIIMGKQKITILNIFISMAVNILCNMLFIPVLGIEGATLSGVIMHVVIILLQLYQIGRYTKCRINQLLPYTKLLRIFCASLIAVLPLYFISRVLSLSYMAEFFIFGPVSFFACIYIFSKLGLIDISLQKRFAFFGIKKTKYT